MAARQPLVKEFMTTMPVRVDESATLRTVLRLMERYNIRHVVVTDENKLKGVLSEREVKAIVAAGHVNVETAPIAPLVVEPAYQVAAEAPLLEVCKVMHREKFGSAVVVSDEKIVGIFTSIDALKVLTDLLSK